LTLEKSQVRLRTLSMSSSGPSKRPKIIRKSQCGLDWLCVTPARHVDWLARLLAVTLSHEFDRGLSNSQFDCISMQCGRLRPPSLCNLNCLDVSSFLRHTLRPLQEGVAARPYSHLVPHKRCKIQSFDGFETPTRTPGDAGICSSAITGPDRVSSLRLLQHLQEHD